MPRSNPSSRQSRRSQSERGQPPRMKRNEKTVARTKHQAKKSTSQPIWDDEVDDMDVAMADVDEAFEKLPSVKSRSLEARRRIEMLLEEKALQQALQDFYDY